MKGRAAYRAVSGGWTAACALALGACGDGLGVEDDRCSGRIGDPSIATSCVIVEGRVLDPRGLPAPSVNVGVECFGEETLACEATPGETNRDGAYRFLVHNVNQEGGPGFVAVRARDRLFDRWGASDTIQVSFNPPGALANVYVLDIRLAPGPFD